MMNEVFSFLFFSSLPSLSLSTSVFKWKEEDHLDSFLSFFHCFIISLFHILMILPSFMLLFSFFFLEMVQIDKKRVFNRRESWSSSKFLYVLTYKKCIIKNTSSSLTSSLLHHYCYDYDDDSNNDVVYVYYP